MKENRKIHLGLLVIAFLIMLLCAGSSPIIKYLSPDSSIFYTMGRSAARGRVLYRDIADHKGFYLFALNWLGAWLTPHSMNGLFFIEIIFAWIKLVFVYKIAYIYLQNVGKSVITALLFMAVATNFLSWNTGNLGEQFALAFQLISFYYMVVYIEKNCKAGKVVEHDPWYMFIHGLCAGVVLFIQANLIAMWIPFGIGLAYILIRSKYINNFLQNLGALLAGVVITIIPVVGYGLLHNCIEDMYYVMFEINFLYSADGRIGKTLGGYLKDFICSPSVIIVILATVGVIVAAKKLQKRYITVTLSAMLLFSIVCMSVSLNANPIYYTVYMPFMIPELIWLASYIMKEKWFIFECLAILLVTVACNMQLMKKIFRIGTSSYAYESAYKMGELIEDKDTKVLALANSLYYNCTDTLPHIRYFTIFGSGLRYETFPYCVDEQYESILSGENEYIMVQYVNDEYSFWERGNMDETMQEYLNENYNVEMEYREGGIHSALYSKK